MCLSVHYNNSISDENDARPNALLDLSRTKGNYNNTNDSYVYDIIIILCLGQ